MSPHGSGKRSKAASAAMTAIGAALAAAACGTSPATTATPIGTPSAPGVRSGGTGSAPPASAQVGADCGIIPAHGDGSLTDMATRQALAATSANPQLSVFTAAARTAGLDKTIGAGREFTLMIPANSAFAALSKTDISRLHNPGDLRKIVTYHAVKARISPAQFERGASYPTIEGRSLTVSRSGAVYKVNGATVLCGNISTASGTVYIISKVLQPPGG